MSVLPHPLQWLALDCREVLQRNFHQNFTPGVAEQPMQDDQGQQRTLGEVWMDVLAEGSMMTGLPLTTNMQLHLR